MKKASYPLWIIGISVLLLLLVPWLTKSNYLLHVFIMIFFFGYLSTCWNILGGFTGQHSFGHAMFVGIGAYTSSLLFSNIGVSPWIGMWVGGLLAGLTGIFLGYLSFRYGLKGPYFLLVTIAFAEIFVYLALNIRSVGGASGINVPLIREEGLKFFQFNEKMPYYYIIMGMLGMIVWISHSIQKSRMGYYFIAIHENEDAAQALGVNLMRYKLFATVLSTSFSALGGTFYAQYFLFIDPPSILGLGLSIEIVFYAIVGGVRTVLGPTFGAFFLIPLGEVTRMIFAGQTGGIHLIIYGAIFIIFVIFIPEGIMGVISRIRLWPRSR
jgi:branched-chain amino acid transport system permease protein